MSKSQAVATEELSARPASLQVRAREAIKQRILTGIYPAGTPLSEEALASELDMSRTPVRQALQELAGQGLLEHVPGRGVSVSRVDIRKMLDIIEVQQCLLEWCAPRICKLADVDLSPVIDAFEQQLAAAKEGDATAILYEARRMDMALVTLTGNQEMVRIMQAISDLLVHAASQAFSSAEKYEQAIREHRAIIDALRQQDAEGALAAVQTHCDGIRRRLLNMP